MSINLFKVFKRRKNYIDRVLYANLHGYGIYRPLLRSPEPRFYGYGQHYIGSSGHGNKL